jgi:hypothetical protein
MRSIPTNSQNLNRTRPHPPTTDRMSSSTKPINRSNIITPIIELRSIFAGGVGRVRSQFLEFGDDYLHKPALTNQ